MKNEDIKKKRDRLYGKIKDANEALNELRENCKHEKTRQQNYSYRIGVVDFVSMCSYCDEIVVTPEDIIKSIGLE